MQQLVEVIERILHEENNNENDQNFQNKENTKSLIP